MNSTPIWGRFLILAVGFVLVLIGLACAEANNRSLSQGAGGGGESYRYQRIDFKNYKETADDSDAISSLTRVTDTPEREGLMCWHASSERLAFTAAAKGDSADIWVTSLSGGAKARLTSSEGDQFSPAWSTDGEHVFFASDSFRGTEIGRVNASRAGGVVRVTTSGGCAHPSVNPVDGTLVFRGSSNNRGLICTSGPDGSLFTQLRSGAFPQWSPDGETILFTKAGDKGTTQIWTMDKDGANPTMLTSGHTDRNPSFSPDGKMIVFSSSDRSGKSTSYRNYDIFIMSVNGTGVTQLTNNRADDNFPIFVGPEKVVFVSGRGRKYGETDIWMVKVNL